MASKKKVDHAHNPHFRKFIEPVKEGTSKEYVKFYPSREEAERDKNKRLHPEVFEAILITK